MCVFEKSFNAGKNRLTQNQFDILLICENLAGKEIEEFCLQIHQNNPLMTIIASLINKNPLLEISLFDAGMDDIITDDISTQIVVKRIMVRYNFKQKINPKRQIYRIDDSLLIDWEAYRVWNQGKLHKITKPLTLLLEYLLKNAGRPISREEAANVLWADSIIDPEGKNLDFHIMHLRRIIEKDPKKPKLIQAVRGVGYVYLPKN